MNARHALEVNRIASESNVKSELMANLGDMPNMMIVFVLTKMPPIQFKIQLMKKKCVTNNDCKNHL